MGLVAYQDKDQLSEICLVPPEPASSDIRYLGEAYPANADLDATRKSSRGTGISVGIRFAILVELVAILFIYGAWRLIHLP